jgi:hypothetical protein
MVDETSASESDYISVIDDSYSGSALSCTLGLSSVGDPADHTSTSVVVKATTDAFMEGYHTLGVTLKSGSTTIKSENFDASSSWTNHTMSLSTTQAGNISNYGDLSVTISATDNAGGATMKVSHVYFTCPDLGPINVTPAHASAASSGQVSTYVEYSLPATGAASALSPTVINESLPAIAVASGQDPTVSISMPDIEVTVQAISTASAVVNSHIVTVIVASAASSALVQTQTVNASASAATSAPINIISWTASASASATALRTTSYVFNSIASAAASAGGSTVEDLFISGIQATAVASAKLGTEVINGVVASSATSAMTGIIALSAPAATAAATAIKINNYVVRPIASAIAGSLSTAGVSEATILSLSSSFRATYNIEEEDAAEGEAVAGAEIMTGEGAGLYAYNEGSSLVTGPTATRVMHYLRGRDGVTVYADDVGNVKFCTGYGLPDQFAVTTNTYLSMAGFDISGTSDIILAFNDEGQVIMKRDIT